MKQAAITGEKIATLVDKDIPRLQEGWALVKIMSAPICAEYKEFVRGHRSDCLGHEAAGEVVEVAPGSKVKVGDRVVVMPQYPCGECEYCIAGDYIYCEHTLNYSAATMAQYIAKPSFLLPKIPDGVSYDEAALACCGLGPSYGALRKMGGDAFGVLLITGLGPVGIGALVNAKFRGARVIAVEMNPYRTHLAMELGADEIVDPRDPDTSANIKALTGGHGPDWGIDCSGVVAAHRLLIDAVRRVGKIAFVGECGAETPLRISQDMLRKGLHLIGNWHYNLNDFPNIMQVIQKSPVATQMITHRLPMSQIQQAFEISSGQNSAKIILHPWE